MIELELSDVSRTVIEELGEVNADEEVLVIADPETVPVSRALANAARAAGAAATLAVMPRMRTPGEEPPETIAAAMRGADAVFAANGTSLGHTEARKAANDSGTRIAILRGIDEEMMIEGAMRTDFARLREITGLVCAALENAEEAHVSTPAGTDLDLSLAGRSAAPLDGYFHEGFGFSNFPPGLAVSSPVEGSAEGRIVFDFSMDAIGRLEGPIGVDVEDGHVVSVDGGSEAAAFRRLLEAADENASNLAEFALGTNPDARLIGNLAEDKKRAGIVDFAVGDNASIGGHTESDLHIDAIVLEATVVLDGVEIIAAGELDLDGIRDVAEG